MDDGGATGHLSQQVTVAEPQAGGPAANLARLVCGGRPAMEELVLFRLHFHRSKRGCGWRDGDGLGVGLRGRKDLNRRESPIHHLCDQLASGVRVAVRLTVTDNNGLTNGVTKSFPVNTQTNAAPTAGFASSCTDLMCTFTDLSNDGDGTIVGFHWDFR